MKLLRFGDIGQEKPGLVDGQGIIRDLSGTLNDIDGSMLGPSELEKIKSMDAGTLPEVNGQVRLGSCLKVTGKIVCVGLNYFSHAEEVGAQIPGEPILFMKPNSAVVGPNDCIEIPRQSTKTDWEVELGVIIGKRAKYIDEEDAYEHVAGYCLANDVSERSFQLDRLGTWDKGKGHDSFAPLGPWLVTRDEIPDPHALPMWLYQNGVIRQQGSTGDMIFKVPMLVAYISQFMTLHPGDVILTGTPAGVGLGLKPPKFIKPDDEIKLGIEGLGEQTQQCIPA